MGQKVDSTAAHKEDIVGMIASLVEVIAWAKLERDEQGHNVCNEGLILTPEEGYLLNDSIMDL